MLDQHLAKRYPDLAPSAELLEKQKIHSTLLNELQAQQQKNRNLTEELDLLKQEEDEVRTATGEIRRLHRQLQKLKSEQTAMKLMASRPRKFEDGLSPTKSDAPVQHLEDIRQLTTQARDAWRDGHGELQSEAEKV